VIVVEGDPGMGKSSLVQHFLGTLPPNALVLCGRCSEQETVPFKGIDSMVDALSEWLLALPEAQVESLIAGGVRYMATVFPVLNRVDVIADATRDARDVANVTALREQAFGEIERLFAALAARGPLVVFLDDLQWADHDSLALLRRAILSPNGPPCLFVSTLRTGIDVQPAVSDVLASATRLALRGLSEPESRQLMDTLWTQRVPRSEALSQRETLVREAAGHPLFLAELVRSARAGTVWQGGEAKLQDVLWDRIRDRDPIERRFLELVAVAGAPMPYEILAKAAEVDVGECQTRLGSLRAAQLIRVSRREGERLVEPYHDRVRESVLHHLETSSNPRAIAGRHLRLGRALLANVPDGALPARIFAVVQHLNAGRALLADRAEEIRVAALNLAAARRAQHATAYERAQGYARVGLALLGDAGWTDAHDVARDLHGVSMASELYSGDFAAAKDRFEAARAHHAAPAERTELYVSWIGLQTTLGQLDEAIQTGTARLAELGLTLRPRVGTLSVVLQYFANRIAQGRRSTDELLHVPDLRDPLQEGIMKVLAALVPVAFFVSQNLIAWIQLKMAGITMRHGACDVSAYGFVGQGTVLAGAFHKHAEAGAFGRLALALDGRFRNAELAPRLTCVYGGWLASWTQPFREGKAHLRKSFELARQGGDTAWEAYAATVLSVVTYCESTSLASVEETGAWAREIAARRKDRDMAGVADAHARCAAALRGGAPRSGAIPDLTIDGSTDADLRASLGAKTPTAMFYYFFCNAELAHTFGDVARAAALLTEAGARTNVIFAIPTMVELALLEALVAARLHDGASRLARLRLRRTVRGRVGMLRRWAESCPENFEPHFLVASAELARIGGAAAEADEAYARAVTAARAYGSTKREAIALELAARHARSRDDAARADRLRAEAIDAYRRWGAPTKADALSV
jgi:hypothetical protein